MFQIYDNRNDYYLPIFSETSSSGVIKNQPGGTHTDRSSFIMLYAHLLTFLDKLSTRCSFLTFDSNSEAMFESIAKYI